MDKKECVLSFVKKQGLVDLSTLDYSLIKTKEQFLANYQKHDVACQHVALIYFQNKYSMTPIGVEQRARRVMVKNSLPNYMAEKDAKVFCFDPKAKSKLKDFGRINERDAISYRNLAKSCHIPVYCVFVQVIGGIVKEKMGYCDVEDEPLQKEIAWNGNPTWKYEWKKGLPHIHKTNPETPLINNFLIKH